MSKRIFFVLLAVALLSAMSMRSDSFQYVVLMIPMIFFAFCLLFIRRVSYFINSRRNKIHKMQKEMAYLELRKLCMMISIRQGRPWMIEELAIKMLKSEDDIQQDIDLGRKLKKIRVAWMIHPKTNNEYPAIFLTRAGRAWIGISEGEYIQCKDIYYEDVSPVMRSTYLSMTVIQDEKKEKCYQSTRKIRPRGIKRRSILKSSEYKKVRGI